MNDEQKMHGKIFPIIHQERSPTPWSHYCLPRNVVKWVNFISETFLEAGLLHCVGCSGTYHPIGSHVEHHQLGWAHCAECLNTVHDTAVQHPKSVAPIRSDSEHGHQVGTVWRRRRQQVTAGRLGVPFPVGIGLEHMEHKERTP